MNLDGALASPADTTPSTVASAPASGSSDADAGGASTPTALTDDQILGVIHTANQGEIEQAKIAEAKGKDGRVKKLALMMLKDHTASDDKAAALAKQSAGSLEPSATSRSLEGHAQGATNTLAVETGGELDREYVDTQVKEHQAVLDMIDQQLLPSAKGADLKDFLTEVRSKVATHLQHAQDLQAAMSKQ